VVSCHRHGMTAAEWLRSPYSVRAIPRAAVCVGRAAETHTSGSFLAHCSLRRRYAEACMRDPGCRSSRRSMVRLDLCPSVKDWPSTFSRPAARQHDVGNALRRTEPSIDQGKI